MPSWQRWSPAPCTHGAHGTASRSTSRLPFSPQPTWVVTKGLFQRPQSSRLPNMLYTHHLTGRGSKFNCRLPTAPIPLGEGWSPGPFLQLTVTPPSLLQHRGPGSSRSVRVYGTLKDGRHLSFHGKFYGGLLRECVELSVLVARSVSRADAGQDGRLSAWQLLTTFAATEVHRTSPSKQCAGSGDSEKVQRSFRMWGRSEREAGGLGAYGLRHKPSQLESQTRVGTN